MTRSRTDAQGHPDGAEVPIVFVHLGDNRARWLPLNIQRTRRLGFSEVWVITDNARMAAHARRLGARAWLPPADDLLTSDAGGNDPGFRRGFWRASLRRFEVLASFHTERGSPVVHLESDVIVLPGFRPSTLKAFGDRLAYPLLQPDSGIGSVVYLGSPDASATLAASIRQQRLRRDETNDMLALGRFAEERPDLVAILPTVDPAWPADCCRDPDFRERASANFGAVGAVFDGATLGQFLLGRDPRNHRGRRIVHQAEPHHGIDATHLDVRMDDGVLLVGPKGAAISTPVLNLHVHSKDQRAFDLGQGEQLLAQRCSTDRTHPRVELDPWGFASQAGYSLRRRWPGRLTRADEPRSNPTS